MYMVKRIGLYLRSYALPTYAFCIREQYSFDGLERVELSRRIHPKEQLSFNGRWTSIAEPWSHLLNLRLICQIDPLGRVEASDQEPYRC